MPRQKTHSETLTIGQLAKRWSVSTGRVHGLIRAGLLAGTFRIPSVGRFGATTKIPVAAVLQAEKEWGVVPADQQRDRRKPPRNRNGALPVLKHFPELELSVESSVESAASGSH